MALDQANATNNSLRIYPCSTQLSCLYWRNITGHVSQNQQVHSYEVKQNSSCAEHNVAVFRLQLSRPGNSVAVYWNWSTWHGCLWKCFGYSPLCFVRSLQGSSAGL